MIRLYVHFLLLIVMIMPINLLAESGVAPRLTNIDQNIVVFDNKDAGFFFNQGLMQTYGFEYQNALESFTQSINIDGECAICYMGKAYAELMLEQQKEFTDSIAKAHQFKNKKIELERKVIDIFYNFSKNLDEKKFLRDFYLVAKYFPRELWIQNIYVAILKKNYTGKLYSIGEEPPSEYSHIHDNIMAILALDENNIGAIHHILDLAQYSKFPQDFSKFADFLMEKQYALYHPYKLAGRLYLRNGRYISAMAAFEKSEKIYQDTLITYQAQGYALKPTRMFLDLYKDIIFNAYLTGQISKADKAFISLKRHISPDDNSMLAQEYLSLDLLSQLFAGKLTKGDALKLDNTNKYLDAIKLYCDGVLNVEASKNDLAEISANKIALINQTLNRQDLLIASEMLNLLILTAKKADKASTSSIDKLDDLLENNPEFLLSFWHLPARILMAESYRSLELYELSQELFEKSLKTFPDNPFGLFGMMKLANRFRNEKMMLDYRERFKKSWNDAEISQPFSIKSLL